MKKTAYLLAALILKTMVSCEKKMAASSQTNTLPPVGKDTLSDRIYTFAGNGYDSAGLGGYSGDGMPAKNTKLWHPDGVAVDAKGNVYIADIYNQRIRKVNTNGIISTIAGNGKIGYSGDGGLATSAQINDPERSGYRCFWEFVHS